MEYLNNGHNTTGSFGDSVVSLILNEGKVVIPGFGYLELTVLPDKRTVLFKNKGDTKWISDSESSIQSQIYENLTVPLKEGKVVNLPEVGIFRPMKNPDGSYRVSYITSSSLLQLLNSGQEVGKADNESALTPAAISTDIVQLTEKEGKEEIREEETVIVEEKEEVKEEALEKEEVKDNIEDESAETVKEEVKVTKEDVSEVPAEEVVVENEKEEVCEVTVEKEEAEEDKKIEEEVVTPAPVEIRADRKAPWYKRIVSKVRNIIVPEEEKTRDMIAIAVALTASLFIVWIFLQRNEINIILLISGFFIPRFFNLKKRDKAILRILWAYHIIFCIYYYFFLRVDSYGYYLTATGQMTSQDFWESLASPGTAFINAVCFLLVNAGLSSYFNLILFFSLLGYTGIVLFYKTILLVIPTNPHWGKIKLFPFLLFLPNMHLWSVAVGKDSLLFFLIALFTYSLLHLRKRFLWALFSVFTAYYIRPHVALILVISMGIASLFRKDVISLFRISTAVVVIGISVFLFSMVLNQFNIEEETVEGVSQFMDDAAEGLSYGGSAVDISAYPYPLKVFTFLFRPFFFDINGIPALIISFENLLWLLLIIQVFKKRPLKTFSNAPFSVQFSLFFFILGILVFSGVVSNLGNIIRQRNMFTPALLLCTLWSFSYYSIRFNKKDIKKAQ